MVAAARPTIYTGPGMKSHLSALGVDPIQSCVRERHTGHYHADFSVPLGLDETITHKHAVRPAAEYADLIRAKLRVPLEIINTTETITSWRDDPADHVRYLSSVTFALGGVGAHRDAPSLDAAPTPPLYPPINSAAVKIASGAWDLGASHRALALARELAKAGLWDGQAEISFHDPQALHNRVFGVEHLPIDSLVLGTDYEIVGITTLIQKPTISPSPSTARGLGGEVKTILCLPAPRQPVALLTPQTRAQTNHICRAIFCLPAPRQRPVALLPATIPERESVGSACMPPPYMASAPAAQPAPQGPTPTRYNIGDLVRVPRASYYRKIVNIHHYGSVFYEIEIGGTFSTGDPMKLRVSEEALIAANTRAGIAH